MLNRIIGSLPGRPRPGATRACGGAGFYRSLLGALLACSAAGPQAHAQVDLARLRTWGLETYNEIDRTLRVPATRLFAETASLNGTQSGGFNGRAYVWPVSTQFRVFNSLAQIQPGTYTPILQQFADQVQGAYWDNGYRSGAGGGDRFYDDNGHLVVALTEAYRLTHNSDYLTRAKDTQSFVMEGEDTVAGGGIYFKQFDFSSKDAISTLQGARGAAMLYSATRQQSYLNDATRLLTWARTHLQRTDGMFSERWNISTNSAEGFDLVNSAGIGISTNLDLYDATGSAAYLIEAQRMGNRTLTRYFDSATGQINDEGFWAFELVDALDNLYVHDRNPLWLNKVNGAMVWLHNNKRDPNGHYGKFWGREGPQIGALDSWNLIEQAAVARAYLYTSAVPEPGGLGLVGLAVAALLCRFRSVAKAVRLVDRPASRRLTAPSKAAAEGSCYASSSPAS
jgi:hypothetical protein